MTLSEKRWRSQNFNSPLATHVIYKVFRSLRHKKRASALGQNSECRLHYNALGIIFKTKNDEN